jgi:uncharacterized protein
MARLDYLELAVKNLGQAKEFYAKALGFEFTDFGPEYSATTSNDTDIGFHEQQKITPPLGVICVENLETAFENVKNAGGNIVVDIFSFPGGRRFEFLDPSGNHIGVWEKM